MFWGTETLLLLYVIIISDLYLMHGLHPNHFPYDVLDDFETYVRLPALSNSLWYKKSFEFFNSIILYGVC